MLTRKRFMKLFILLMVVSLVIAACDRPLPNNDDETTQTNDNTGYPVATQPAIGEGNTATDPGEPGEAEVPAEGTEGEAEPGEAEVPAEATSEAPSETGGEGEVSEGGEAEGSGEPSEAEVPAETPSEGTEGEGEPEAGEAEVPAETSEPATGSEEGETGEPSEAEVPAEAEGGQTEAVPVALPATHTVAAGENLYRIGLEYGLSWVVIAEANGITNPNRIYEGQVIDIPGGGNGEQGAGGQQPEPMPTPEGINYVVKPGDTLFKIAQQYEISWMEIAEANGLVNPNEIYAGQMIKIPVDGPMPPQTIQHVVQPGETLFRISLHYGVSWLAIAHANQINAPYNIYVGQTLIIPGGP